jgi:hypothetical protein
MGADKAGNRSAAGAEQWQVELRVRQVMRAAWDRFLDFFIAAWLGLLPIAWRRYRSRKSTGPSPRKASAFQEPSRGSTSVGVEAEIDRGRESLYNRRWRGWFGKAGCPCHGCRAFTQGARKEGQMRKKPRKPAALLNFDRPYNHGDGAVSFVMNRSDGKSLAGLR